MYIKDILALIPEAEIEGISEKEITGIQYDSRCLQKGDLFVAISGFKTDGHHFIPEAVEKGVAAVLVEQDISVPSSITKIKVPDCRLALARLSSYYYDYPSQKLKLIGVTGTNGKTSVSYLISNMLNVLNLKCGVIGTVEKRLGKKLYQNPNTTPESLVLQGILSDMVKEKADAAVMEVSSHALELHRVEDCYFDLALFTNLTHDHLDFHHNMEKYFASKAKLFTKLKKPGWAIVNTDDNYGFRLVRQLAKEVNYFTYGLNDRAHIKAKNYETEKGISFDLVTPFGSTKIYTPNLLGIYNLYNILAASSAALALGLKLEEIQWAIRNIQKIPGRFEQIQVGQEFSVIVDYAHTPDGVQKVLQLANTLQKGKGKVITVLGAAGERDPYKRPIMGKFAAELSDIFVITEQDSRSENSEKIINDIYEGAKGWGNVKVVPDRIEAIQYALSKASGEDMVLILGKGHEKTLYLNRDVNYEGDLTVVRDYLV